MVFLLHVGQNKYGINVDSIPPGLVAFKHAVAEKAPPAHSSFLLSGNWEHFLKPFNQWVVLTTRRPSDPTPPKRKMAVKVAFAVPGFEPPTLRLPGRPVLFLSPH